MFDTTRMVRDGIVFAFVAASYLLVLLRCNPRMFLRHYPKEVQAVVPPRSGKERRIAGISGLLIGLLLASALFWRTATSRGHSFGEHFIYAFGVLCIFNLVDLIVLDWLIVCWIEPRWVILPGTEHLVIPKQYRHHFNGFLIGTAGIVVVSVAIAAILAW